MDEQSFMRHFSSEGDCGAHMFKTRWPDGCRCPRCQNDKVYPADDGTIECCSCDYKKSLKVGTPLEGSRLSLHTWFHAIWYASSVPFPGKVQANTYRKKIAGIRSNRPALSVKHTIDRALLSRCKFEKLTGKVEISIIHLKIMTTPLYLLMAGEVEKRTVLRIWAELFSEKPKNVYSFVERYIEKGTELNYQAGLADRVTLEKMGYSCGSHRCDYDCKTIENASHSLISELQNTRKLSDARNRVRSYCFARNSLYTQISFDELIKRVIDLPPLK